MFRFIVWLTPLALVGCALTPPAATVASLAPSQWQAPLPASPDLAHGGSLLQLTQWWQQFNDPVLTEFVIAGQTASATVAAAQTRLAQARLTLASATATLLPSLKATARASRARVQPNLPLATTLQGGLQTTWEIDLFGGARSTESAAQLRLAGAQALWHDARVSMAAEVALQYFSLRVCHQQTLLSEGDAASRTETARLSDLTANAGFTAPATAALARASALEASARLRQQRADCAVQTKALVALTALPEADVQQKIASLSVNNDPNSPLAGLFESSKAIFFIANPITSLPAHMLAQRPDVFNAEREVAAASQDVGAAQAQRYPRLGLSGSVGRLGSRSGGLTTGLNTWSIGPLELSVPVLDGGLIRANIEAASATYDQAVVQYRSVVRQAVREVEEALVNLDSTQARQADSDGAADGYRRSFVATEARYRSGLASLVELEDARRSLLAARTMLITLQKERYAAWVALYRAAGGGWSTEALPLDTPRNPS
ncbi:MAG: efflux transporter outer membrane subunit [Polaromonas sp.]|nr:efflux transporter outer membrane subunit [Polaromonas sp.]